MKSRKSVIIYFCLWTAQVQVMTVILVYQIVKPIRYNYQGIHSLSVKILFEK